MTRWWLSWQEATKRPWMTQIILSLSGLVVGGLVGYFRFGHSAPYGVALALGAALILGAIGRRTIRDPSRVGRSRPVRANVLRVALPFIALAVAIVAGAASASVTVFLVTLAAGLVIAVVFRLIVLR